uniref:G-protein coupled receptors family 1 profile domain-containing protein n=1 Tax=Wuchereria bancrofti TaxID=6293 RepID=A0A1I8ESP3_WUCBA
MSNNATNICLTNQQMRLHGNEVEKYLQRFLYPCIVILGITGNVLNLTVLLNRSMRSRSNIFLSALALADIIFLLLLLPNILATYPIFTLVVAVCADRLIGIRRPLHAKTDCNKYCTPRWFWNRTNPYSATYRNFIDISVTVNAVTTIILPIFLLSFFNFLLLCILRNRRDLLLVSTNQRRLPKKKRSLQYLKMEHRVTLMVTLIVTTFIILNGPSAVIHLVNLARKKKLNYNFTLLGNTLVIIDKACNFILFCLTSRHFRARLFQLTQRKVNRFSASFLQISDSMRRIGSTHQ